MKKRLLSSLLAVCLALTAASSALGATSLSNFYKIREYRGDFTDIPASAWYYESVSGVFELGIMDGRGGGLFDPSGMLTIAEAIKIAATIHKCYFTGSTDFSPGLPGSPGYALYVDYAKRNVIPVADYRNMNTAATKADFTAIISSALPDEAVTPINRIRDGAIPDVFESYSYGRAVYRLYRAGVLTGSDNEGTFFPGRTLTRAEAAAIIVRVADANIRVIFSLATELTAEQIYRLASPAVFFIEVLDDGEVIKTGSGFFISGSGLAITNYHVVIGASDVRITTNDGRVLDVVGIYDFDWKKDSALIQIDGEGFPFLECADSSLLQTGATVYALGSPLGLQASFSKGIVSQSQREIEGIEYIQLDAAISSGSSGGALLDSAGRAVGVTSATMLGSQNINLAIPINFFSELCADAHVPLESILIPTAYYRNYHPAPDFGAYFGVTPIIIESVRSSGVSYSYGVADLPGEPDEIYDEYTHLVMQNFFEYSGILTRGDGTSFKMYYNPWKGVMITFGPESVDGLDYFNVTVS